MSKELELNEQDLAICKAAFSDAMKANSQSTELKVAIVNLEIKLSNIIQENLKMSVEQEEEPTDK